MLCPVGLKIATQTQHFHPQGEDVEKEGTGGEGGIVSVTFDENLWLWAVSVI